MRHLILLSIIVLGFSLVSCSSKQGAKNGGQGVPEGSAIEGALAPRLSAFQKCYERLIVSGVREQGTLVMGWQVAPNGLVKNVRAVKSAFSPQMNNCLKKEISAITFPSNTTEYDVTYPFTFSSEEK